MADVTEPAAESAPAPEPTVDDLAKALAADSGWKVHVGHMHVRCTRDGCGPVEVHCSNVADALELARSIVCDPDYVPLDATVVPSAGPLDDETVEPPVV